MPNVEFLKTLNKKLKTGNLRGIHLNALPGRYATRLDAAKLKLLSENEPQGFLDKLINNSSFKHELTFRNINLNILDNNQRNQLYLIAKRLDSIYYENNDNFLEHGIKTFGFGYPLLIKRSTQSPSKIVKAPLFIWNLDIQKSARVQNDWFISREEDYPLSVNEILISHLQIDENISIEIDSNSFVDNGNLSKNDLLNYVFTVLKQLNTQINKSDISIKIDDCPDRDQIDKITSSTPWIQWSGIFGLYKSRKQSIIKDFDYLIDNYNSFEFEKLIIEHQNTSSVTAVPTDPSQEEIINTLFKSRSKIIQGPPGTGKSQSLTAIITNALANGQKCLVVCEKKTALDVIQKNLFEIGLDELCIVIDDIYKDRKKVIENARDFIDKLNTTISGFRELDFIEKNKRYEELKQKLNTHQKKILNKIFGDDNWKALIGKFLHACKNYTLKTNEFFIDKGNYDFDFEEYQKLNKIVKDGQYLSNQINVINHPLDILNNHVFKNHYFRSHEKQIYDNLVRCYKFGKNIRSNITYGMGDNKKLYNLNNKVIDIWLSILAKVSKQHKDIYSNKHSQIVNFNQLIRFHKKLDYFKFKWPSEISKLNLEDINKILYNYLSCLINILKNYQDFKDYYNWRSFYISLSDKEKLLIDKFLELNPTDWPITLQSWYINQVLLKYESKIGPFIQDDRIVKELLSLEFEVKNLLRDKILHKWQNTRNTSIGSFNDRHQGSIKSLYNYRKNKQYERRNSLRKILSIDFDLFTDIFPVLLVNPIVCSSIIPLKEGIFGLAIFDEASQLRLEDTYPAFLRGKFKIISGDIHQMPPSNFFDSKIIIGDDNIEENDFDFYDDTIDLADSESLLKYADNSSSSCSYLDFHYRSRHPFLIDFSNAAFYGNRLVPMPNRRIYKPIRISHVNGVYKDRTNLKEAEIIIDFLFNKIKPEDNGHYPSVGIATFNINQRNLILDLIHNLCSSSDEITSKFDNYCKNGFFVKNLENIQGDERDIIIISTTFGLNEENVFSQNFGPLNQEKGYKLLNVIITRAKKHLIIFTSIPPKYYSNYVNEISTHGNLGKGILYAYLAYADAIENDSDEVRKSILELLSKNCSSTNKTTTETFIESPFEQEVYDYLIKHIEKDRIFMQYPFGGFRIDFVIKPKNTEKPLIALECDGAAYHSSEEAYSYDMFRQKTLESYGFKFYRIWSTNWWGNPKDEVKKLLNYIESIDHLEGIERLNQ